MGGSGSSLTAWGYFTTNASPTSNNVAHDFENISRTPAGAHVHGQEGQRNCEMNGGAEQLYKLAFLSFFFSFSNHSSYQAVV